MWCYDQLILLHAVRFNTNVIAFVCVYSSKPVSDLWSCQTGIITLFIMTHYLAQRLSWFLHSLCKVFLIWTVICVCASEESTAEIECSQWRSYYPLIMIYSGWVNMSVIGDDDDYDCVCVCVFRAVMWCEVMMAAASVSQSASSQAIEKSQLTLKGRKSSLFWSSAIEHQHCDWFICNWCDACVFALCCVSSRGWCALNNNLIAARSCQDTFTHISRLTEYLYRNPRRTSFLASWWPWFFDLGIIVFVAYLIVVII